jgi:flagellar motor switch protein FliG
MYGNGNTTSNISVSTFEESRDAQGYCNNINELRLEGDSWIFARTIEENQKISSKKPVMANFDFISNLSNRDIQYVLRETDSFVLSKALKSASEEVREKFKNNMSKRSAEMLIEDMDYMGPVSIDESKRAQKEILRTMMELSRRGQITILDEVIE